MMFPISGRCVHLNKSNLWDVCYFRQTDISISVMLAISALLMFFLQRRHGLECRAALAAGGPLRAA